jgi:hypothetical protein
MRSTAIAALAVAGLASTVATTPARADAPTTHGLICQFATVADPTAEAGTQSGELSGGPVLLTGADGTTPETGTLTCRVQVDQPRHAGTGPSVSGHGTGVLTAGPSVINYTAAATSNVYLCSEFTDDSDGVTYYWDDYRSEWSLDATVACGPTLPEDPGPSPEPILIDSIVCPVFAVVFAPEGDIVLPDPIGAVWDCPPYGNT